MKKISVIIFILTALFSVDVLAQTAAPDVIQDEESEPAQLETDSHGAADRKTTGTKAFNNWMNKGGPDFNDKLGSDDWMGAAGAMKF